MQNLVVILFPLLIDGINSIAQLNNPTAKFWVSIVTSLVAGMLLNFQALLVIVHNPTIQNSANFITLLGLIVASTQGIYLKYWENHSMRSKIMPTVAGGTNNVSE